jgi:5-methylcytosine-specific restriction endonuclease McrA
VPKTPEDQRARCRHYHATHREEILARKRANQPEYWQDNREEITRKRQEKRAKESPEETEARLIRQRAYTKKYKEKHAPRLKAEREEKREIIRPRQRQVMAEWRKNNPEKNHAAQVRQRENNRDKRNAQSRARKAARTPEQRAEIAAKRAAQRLANHEEFLARERASRLRNPETTKASTKNWFAAHPEKAHEYRGRRRARKAAAPVNDFTAAQWKELQEAFDHRCAYCGKRAKGRLTRDHIVPLSKGGPHTLSNIVPACSSCNSRKNVKPPLKPVQPLLLTLAPAKKEKKR